tara:strand:+ start:2203 stop:2448 length:246 start_codon:yes stop_codon:yes gene_type:complete
MAGLVGIALRGFGKALGKLAKKKKKKTFLDRESKVIKRIKQRKRDDAIFKGVLAGTGLVGLTGVRMESAMRDKERRKKKSK